ncbi:DUF1838 domain-containing protein [Leptothoe kymatousa]|uniref:DUF1838 domain-containing protein n=1 Tax=Leptothoe kymatousa TAU-MAC 1615 TaxID=2364775 RepID=A0ABS5Y633_9CYAN|nr:DUF1838 domain-containing protein [Leptothoe kymatousa]MBT9312809.1 DUF1838 domain-containing protein [Leptothoe kymatousa TAU-MAC 1615]
MANKEMFAAREWVKVRNATTEEESFLTWNGAVYAFIPGQPKHHLFNIVGMNVSRCLDNHDESWNFVSRELSFYLDPKTNEILHRWQNPWTGETVPVIHIANSPVQGRQPYAGEYGANVDGDFTTFAFDLFSTYPNPLAGDDRFLDYSPQEIYQAVELFKLTVPTKALRDPSITSISPVILGWERIGPWVPWMKMGSHPGHLIYSASGRKLAGFEELPGLLKEQIQDRIPVYRHAPKSSFSTDNITSWRYFKKHFEAYLAGKEFPLPDC